MNRTYAPTGRRAQAVTLIITPSRRPGRYQVRLGDQMVEASTTVPLFTAARRFIESLNPTKLLTVLNIQISVGRGARKERTAERLKRSPWWPVPSDISVRSGPGE